MTTKEDAARAQTRLVRSAKVIEASSVEQVDSADRRTTLAADRTVLAAERTYAAWMRTGLAALAAGIGAKALLDGVTSPLLATLTASVLILFSGFCFGAAVWRDATKITPPAPDTPRMPAWLLIAVSCFLLLVSLAALAGVLGWPVGRQG